MPGERTASRQVIAFPNLSPLSTGRRFAPLPDANQEERGTASRAAGGPRAGRSDINLLGGDLFAVQRRGALGRRADGAQGWGVNQGEVSQLATDTDETGRNFHSAVTGC